MKMWPLFPSFFRSVLALTLLAIAPGVRGQLTANLTVLHSFTATNSNNANTDGNLPYSSLIAGGDGFFYGTTENGGPGGKGTIYKIGPGGAMTVLHHFNGTDGASPLGALVKGRDGFFYGTTNGTGTGGGGTVFKITPAGVLTTLHNFTGSDDGNNPYAPALIQGADDSFYGTTESGGTGGVGTVFKITAAGVKTVLHNFVDSDGGEPLAGLTLGNDGNFYGTTYIGGTNSAGTIFKMTPAGALITLYSFKGGIDGADLYAGVLKGKDGNFYGTAEAGGVNGLGTVFKITPAGVFTVLHSFSDTEAAYPIAGLLQASDGNFYGTTYSGGANGLGAIYEITPAGVLTIADSFDTTSGQYPYSSLIQDSSGYFYGTTTVGGTDGGGSVYRLLLTSAPGKLSFSATAYNVNENGGSATITVDRTAGSAGAVTVHYATSNGSGVASVDYTAASGTLSWAAGDTSVKTFVVPIADEGLAGGNKNLNLTLSAPTGGASLGTIPTAIVTILDNDAAAQPTIAIASPPDGITVISGASIPFAASVTDPNGITSLVRFTVNGIPVYQTSGAGPYVYAATAPPIPGPYVVNAIVTDTQGRTSTSSVTVNVIAPNPSVGAPTAALLTPVDGRSLAAGVTVTINVASTADAATTLSSVSLYADGVLIASFDANGNPLAASGTGRPVRRDASASNVFQTSYTLPFASQIINLVCVAIDQLGQSSVSSVASIHSTVTDDQAPVVAVAGLADGAHVVVGTPQTLSVSASDPDSATTGGVSARGPVRQDSGGDAILSEVEYYLNGLSVAGAGTSPYGFSFTPATPGKYVLDAVATDASGLATISEPVVVEADPLDTGDLPTVNLVVGGTGSAFEGGSNGIVLATRTGDTSAPLTVFYKTKGAAKAGVDYKKLSGMVTIQPGATKAKIKIKPINGSPNADVVKVKVVLLPPADDSYVVGTTPVKIKIVGK